MSFFPSLAFLTDNAGAGEWVVLFVVILIVVGPKKLPEVVRKIGRTMEMFRRAADEFKDQLMNMDQEPTAPSASASVAPKTDVDGVPNSEAPNGLEAPAPGSYNDAYPNMADYPGNEDRVENWSSGPLPSEPPVAAAPPLQAGDSASAGQLSGDTAAGISAPQVADSAKGKPAEGKA